MKTSIGPKPFGLPLPVWLIGTYDANDRPNIATVSWASICCDKPPCVAVALRHSRLTYDNINLHQAFTVSIPATEHLQAVDYCGMASGRQVDKFEVCGWQAEKSTHVHAPFVAEFPVVLECRVKEAINLGTHTQFIGEILNVQAETSLIPGADPSSNTSQMETFVYGGTVKGAYHAVRENIGKAFFIGKTLEKNT